MRRSNTQQVQAPLAAARYPEAEAAFVGLCQLEPEVAEVHANLSVLYFQDAKFDRPFWHYAKFFYLKPALARASTVLAFLKRPPAGERSGAYPV